MVVTHFRPEAQSQTLHMSLSLMLHVNLQSQITFRPSNTCAVHLYITWHQRQKGHTSGARWWMPVASGVNGLARSPSIWAIPNSATLQCQLEFTRTLAVRRSPCMMVGWRVCKCNTPCKATNAKTGFTLACRDNQGRTITILFSFSDL